MGSRSILSEHAFGTSSSSFHITRWHQLYRQIDDTGPLWYLLIASRRTVRRPIPVLLLGRALGARAIQRVFQPWMRLARGTEARRLFAWVLPVGSRDGSI